MDAAQTRRRDIRVISLVGVAHGFSHFFQLALPPMFPLMHRIDGYSYLDLGALVTVMYVASALLQPPAGFLVDRFGARRALLAGLAAMSGGIVLYGVAPSYEVMLLGAVLIGMGNSVFHPCDFSVMSATVSEPLMGRAFSLHMFGGYIGYGLAPVVMAALGAAIGWQSAIAAAGVAGIAVAALIALFSGDFQDSRQEARRTAGPAPAFRGTVAALFQPPMMLCWLFFCLVAMAQIGLQTKTAAVLTFPDTYALSVESAGVVVSTMLFGVTGGVLIGGYVADKTTHHDVVIGLGYGLGAALMLLLWLVQVPFAVLIGIYLVTGVVYGIAFPSRDMLVRRSTPKGASGKVFGFVYSGMDVGSFITPVVFGWFIDHGLPMTTFLCVALLWVVSVLVLKATNASAARRFTAPAAAE